MITRWVEWLQGRWYLRKTRITKAEVRYFQEKSEKSKPRTSVKEALAAWEKKGPTSLTVALLADALYGVRDDLWELTEMWFTNGTGEEADDLYTVDACAQQVRNLLYPMKNERNVK